VLSGGSALVEVESIIPDGAAATNIASAPVPSPGRVSGAPSVAETRVASLQSKPASPAAVAGPAPSDPILAIAAAATGSESAAERSTRVAAVPTSSQGPAPHDARGIFLQLAAFGSQQNAESYLARAKVQLDWLAGRLHVLGRDGLFRVHAGPYASATEARQSAERVALSLGVKPVVVTR
jgi:rare lipoprotein A